MIPTALAAKIRAFMFPRVKNPPSRKAHEAKPRPSRLARWLDPLAEKHLHPRNGYVVVPAPHPPATAGEKSETLVRDASLKVAVVGTGAAALSTGAAVSFVGPGPALVMVPLAAAGIYADLRARTAQHLKLVRRIGDLYGVKIDPSTATRLHAIAWNLVKADRAKPGDPDFVRLLVETEVPEIVEALGKLLLGETIVRNVIPGFGLLASPLTSVRLTHRLGNVTRRYAIARAAVERAMAALTRRERRVFAESLWFVFAASGAVSDVESLVLADLVRFHTPKSRERILRRIRGGEAAWRRRMAKSRLSDPQKLRIRQAITALAAADGALGKEQRKFLESAEEALGGGVRRRRAIRAGTRAGARAGRKAGREAGRKAAEERIS